MAAGTVPLAKSRLPVPSSTGNTSSRYSSIRSFWISVCASSPLPWTCSSPAKRFLSAGTSAAASRTSSDPRQSNAVRVREATNFGSPFSLPATGSSGSVTFGQ